MCRSQFQLPNRPLSSASPSTPHDKRPIANTTPNIWNTNNESNAEEDPTRQTHLANYNFHLSLANSLSLPPTFTFNDGGWTASKQMVEYRRVLNRVFAQIGSMQVQRLAVFSPSLQFQTSPHPLQTKRYRKWVSEKHEDCRDSHTRDQHIFGAAANHCAICCTRDLFIKLLWFWVKGFEFVRRSGRIELLFN